eukprot:2798408-Lingulodinium_polyedra.AAC.1
MVKRGRQSAELLVQSCVARFTGGSGVGHSVGIMQEPWCSAMGKVRRSCILAAISSCPWRIE